MILNGKLGTYDVVWKYAGWSYATPILRVQRKFMGFKYWKRVWTGPSRSSSEAEKMLPDRMIRWFCETVEEYENHKEKWKQYREGLTDGSTQRFKA